LGTVSERRLFKRHSMQSEKNEAHARLKKLLREVYYLPQKPARKGRIPRKNATEAPPLSKGTLSSDGRQGFLETTEERGSEKIRISEGGEEAARREKKRRLSLERAVHGIRRKQVFCPE